MARGAFWHGETNGGPFRCRAGKGSPFGFGVLGERPLEALLISISSIFVAEMGDRTQLLSLVLAARFRRPWAILFGVFVATLANHAAAGVIGALFGTFLTRSFLDALVGVSMIVMALWTLKPDKLDEDAAGSRSGSAFLATLIAFFIAEIGDKTQLATMALAAAYSNLLAVVSGTTLGMLLANAPVIFLGNAFSDRLPLKAIHYGAAALFTVIGLVFLIRAFFP